MLTASASVQVESKIQVDCEDQNTQPDVLLW